MKKQTKIIIYILILFPCLIMIFDYLNLPSLFLKQVKNINYELLSICFNIISMVSIFIITYIEIHSREIQKNQNAEATGYILMKSSYLKCRNTLEILEDQIFLEKYIVPKVDFNKSQNDDIIFCRLINEPFTEYEQISNLAINGGVSNKDLTTYLYIMDEFKIYVSHRITFYDIDKYSQSEQSKQMSHYVKGTSVDLRKLISDEIETLGRKINKE